MKAIRRLCGVMVVVALGTACASTPLLREQECYDADAQLMALLGPFEALHTPVCAASSSGDGAECWRLRRQIEHLALVCVAHSPTLLANAVIAYDEGQTAKAQQWLDLILARPARHPEAAVLRARIAIDEGNTTFARRLLEQEIRLAPDYAALHETLGAALYLNGNLPEARQEITLAAALGAPAWRVAYHGGLIEEALGHLDDAERRYADALAGNPDWEPARAHLTAIRARRADQP